MAKMRNLVIAVLFLWSFSQVKCEITAAKYGGGSNHSTPMDGFQFDSLAARQVGRTCPNGNEGPSCGGGYSCCQGEFCCDGGCAEDDWKCCNTGGACKEDETCCPKSCAYTGWKCCGDYAMPEGADCCEDSFWCEPGTSCISCPQGNPLYPGQHCCDKTQTDLEQFLPSSISFSYSIPALPSSIAFGGPYSSSGGLFGSIVADSSLGAFSSGGFFSGGASSGKPAPTPESSSGGSPPASQSHFVNYQYYTTTWIYYYAVWYATTNADASTTIESSTTTETTVISVYANNDRAASSQFSTVEATISDAATSMQARMSSSLFASGGAASATGSGSGMGQAIRVDTATMYLLVVGAVLPGVLAVIL